MTTLVNEGRSAGAHDVTWRPAEGGVGPGIYFVRLAARGEVGIRKVVILR